MTPSMSMSQLIRCRFMPRC